MDKDYVVHISNGILLSHENKQNWVFTVMWMNLESVIQSEEIQKKKNKYCILMHIYILPRKIAQKNLFAWWNRYTNI